MTDQPQVTRSGILDMQVCVPKEWTNKQVLEFAENQNPCGTSCGWQIRKQGCELLGGCDERVTCCENKNKVHIMLDA